MLQNDSAARYVTQVLVGPDSDTRRTPVPPDFIQATNTLYSPANAPAVMGFDGAIIASALLLTLLSLLAGASRFGRRDRPGSGATSARTLNQSWRST
jgi:hypothetical protein